MPLTDIEIRKAKPGSKPIRLFERLLSVRDYGWSRNI
jgi:hypothetical protein